MIQDQIPLNLNKQKRNLLLRVIRHRRDKSRTSLGVPYPPQKEEPKHFPQFILEKNSGKMRNERGTMIAKDGERE
jgi:hypothetical protein